MTDGHTLRSRLPGQSAISDIVRSQAIAPKPSRWGRLFGANPLLPENRALYRGALGEVLVGDALNDLGPEWDVLHGVPVGPAGDDIEHVVIGPPGVFTIYARNHTGEEVSVTSAGVTANGVRTPHLAVAEAESGRAASLLSAAAGSPVEVRPVVVIVGATRLRVRQQHPTVAVVSAPQLLGYLVGLERTLTGVQVAVISDVADRPASWHTGPHAPAVIDSAQVHRDFALLRAEVTRASRLRTMWAVVGIIACCALLWSMIAIFVSHVVAH